MSELLPIFVFSVVLALCSHYLSEYDFETNEYARKEKLLWIVITVAMTFFVGLRVGYNDTFAYRWSYENFVNNQFDFSKVNWSIGSNPGYQITCIILKSLGCSVQLYLLFFAAATLIPYIWFLRKYASNFPLAVYLLFTLGCFTFTLAAIKQCIAMSICLIAIDRAINKKYLAFVFFVLLATTFHPYSLLFFITPLLFFKPWGWETWAIICLFGLLGVFLQPMMGVVINITSMLGEEYTVESISGTGVNIGRFAVVSVPLVLGFIARRAIDEECTREQALFYNFTVLNAVFMFVALFGNANYFGRLANYFLYSQALSIPWLLQFFDHRSRRFLLASTVLCYFAYFYYANVINQHFDAIFSSISFWDYIKSLFQGK